MEMRRTYQQVLSALMESDARVVMMDADLASASGSGDNFRRFPDRCINVGISEANMISSAAGLSLTGLLPFVHSFAPFVTRRVYDQLYMSGVYSHNRLHIYGSDPGFWAQHNGGTHSSYEDIALMRALPRAVVTAPCDAAQFAWVLREFIRGDTLFYTRATRKDLPDLYDESEHFALGKIMVHPGGLDAVVFAVGAMVHEALEAQRELAKAGIYITVLDCFSLKPFDEETAREYIGWTKVLVTAENHSIIGGLSSIVAQVMSGCRHQARLYPVAVMDTFGEVGAASYLKEKHGLTARHIAALIQEQVG